MLKNWWTWNGIVDRCLVFEGKVLQRRLYRLSIANKNNNISLPQLKFNRNCGLDLIVICSTSFAVEMRFQLFYFYTNERTCRSHLHIIVNTVHGLRQSSAIFISRKAKIQNPTAKLIGWWLMTKRSLSGQRETQDQNRVWCSVRMNHLSHFHQSLNGANSND